ncbi:hypothetical protein Tco_1463081 [Tanacetum coccineum]
MGLWIMDYGLIKEKDRLFGLWAAEYKREGRGLRPTFVNDEYGIDLEYSENESEDIEDEDDLEDFINDETEEDDATDAEDSDDDF